MRLVNQLKSVVKEPKKIFLYANYVGLLNWMPDKLYLKLMFKVKMNKKLNLNNPITFNEKLQWLKLYDRKEIYTEYVDKLKVRDIVRTLVGDSILIPLYGVYEDFESINFESLPNSFVLKCTHDSGGVIVCQDKNKLNIKDAKKIINRSFKRNFFYNGREWPYKDVKPKLICEQYLRSTKDTELIDYKFMCFNGKVKCSFICSGRNTNEGLNVTFYDLDWKKLPFERYYPKSNFNFQKPVNYNKMIEISEILSQNTSFMRVDFYELDGVLYFGEMTLYPGSGFEGFEPFKYDKLLGDWITLPN